MLFDIVKNARNDNVPTRICLLTSSLLCLLTVIVYWNVVNSGFINFDDPLYLLDRPEVWNGLTLESIRWAFTSATEGNWIPLTWLSYLLDVSLFGINARAHHAVNLLFHLANTLLLLLALHRMTGRYWRSIAVAALFALHPLHVESVAWIAERKDVLSGLFFMLTLLAYHAYTISTSVSRYLVVLLVYTLGLCSKSMLVTMPFLLLLLDYWPFGRLSLSSVPATAGSPGSGVEREGGQGPGARGGEISALPNVCSNQVPFTRLAAEKLPLLGLSMAASMVTFSAQKNVGAMFDQNQSSVPENIANALVSYFMYLYKAVIPANLAVAYPFPKEIPLWQPLLSVLSLSLVTYLVIRGRFGWPYLVTGWFWFVGMLVPVIGIVRVGNQAMADRYTYLPHIGLFILAVWGSADFCAVKGLGRRFLAAFAVALLGIFSLMTWRQVGYWKDSVTLFSHAASVFEDNWLAYEKIASALSKRGEMQQALLYANESIRINPLNPDIYIVLGIIYNNLRQRDLASDSFRKAIQLNPGREMAHLLLGRNLLLNGDLDGAMAEYYMLLDIKPERAKELLEDISQVRQVQQ